jgi:DNA-binding response OmpR family regulator
MSNILLIEPDKVLARTYSSALESSGLRVQTASNAQDAIHSADDIPPDLIVLELQLVGHSGIEFLYEFRSYPEWQDVPVILFTTVPVHEFEDNWKLLCRELGVHKYLYKPLTSLSKLISVANDLVIKTSEYSTV